MENQYHPVQTTRRKSGVGIQKSRVESGRVPKHFLNLLKARILFPTFSNTKMPSAPFLRVRLHLSWTKINLKIHLSNIPQPQKPNFCTAPRHLGTSRLTACLHSFKVGKLRPQPKRMIRSWQRFASSVPIGRSFMASSIKACQGTIETPWVFTGFFAPKMAEETRDLHEKLLEDVLPTTVKLNDTDQSLISWSTDIKDGMVVVYTHQSKNGNPATSCVGCFIPVTGLLTIPWYFSTVSNPTFDFGNCLWPQHMAIKTLGNHMYTVGFWGPYPKFLSDDGSTKQYTII